MSLIVFSVAIYILVSYSSLRFFPSWIFHVNPVFLCGWICLHYCFICLYILLMHDKGLMVVKGLRANADLNDNEGF